MHFLIVTANFYEDISQMLLDGAIAELKKGGHSFQKITVPGALEIPATISYAADTEQYDGFLALGCVIRGETSHYDIVANESARGISELAVNLNLAIGNGILTVENKEQAIVRADPKQRNKGAFIAQTAIRMATIRDKFFEMLNHD